MEWAKDAWRMKRARDVRRMKWIEEAQGVEWTSPVAMLGNED